MLSIVVRVSWTTRYRCRRILRKSNVDGQHFALEQRNTLPGAMTCGVLPGHIILLISCRSHGISFPTPAKRCARISRKRPPNRSVGATYFALLTSSAMPILRHASLGILPICSADALRFSQHYHQRSAFTLLYILVGFGIIHLEILFRTKPYSYSALKVRP